jgi:hypothetical protein
MMGEVMEFARDLLYDENEGGNGRGSFTCRKDNMSRTDEWYRTSYRTSSGKTSSVVGNMTARVISHCEAVDELGFTLTNVDRTLISGQSIIQSPSAAA